MVKRKIYKCSNGKCGKDFERLQSQMIGRKYSFCSRECMIVFQKSKDSWIHKIPPYDRFGEKNPKWSGGRSLDKSGYVLVYNPNHPNSNAGGYIREHRLVMSSHLGRPLKDEEIVHHKNGIKDDNVIGNLMLLKNCRKHRKIDNYLRKRNLLGRFC